MLPVLLSEFLVASLLVVSMIGHLHVTEGLTRKHLVSGFITKNLRHLSQVVTAID